VCQSYTDHVLAKIKTVPRETGAAIIPRETGIKIIPRETGIKIGAAVSAAIRTAVRTASQRSSGGHEYVPYRATIHG